MRKTKKRVTAATKLQALARGKQIRSQQKRQNNAVTKLQALARGKRDRRAATVKKQQKQVKGRSAYKSYLSSFTVDNTQKVGGFSGLNTRSIFSHRRSRCFALILLIVHIIKRQRVDLITHRWRVKG